MNTSAVSHIQGWAPRCLIVPDVFDTPTSASVPPRADGLTPVELRWNDERLISVRLLQDSSGVPEHLLLPRLVEPHAHLDKAFTWEQAPNLEGTYSGALTANLAEHQTRTTAQVRDRAERALQQAFRHGLRAMRSHIDSLGPGADCSWRPYWTPRAAGESASHFNWWPCCRSSIGPPPPGKTWRSGLQPAVDCSVACWFPHAGVAAPAGL